MADRSKIEQEALEHAKKNSADYSQSADRITDDTLAKIQASVDAQSQAVSQANEQAQQQNQSDYGRLMQGNAVQEAVARKSVENALTRLGYSSPALNQTEDLALQSRLGQANYSAQQQQEQALRLLADLLTNYKSQSSASQIEASAGLQNNMQDAALNERMAGFQNAMTSAAAGYQAQREAEAEAERRALEEEKRWAALQPQEQAESFPVKQLTQLVKSGLSVEDALAVMTGQQTAKEQGRNVWQGEVPKNMTPWDAATPWQSGREKQWKAYGETEQGRQEAVEQAIENFDINEFKKSVVFAAQGIAKQAEYGQEFPNVKPDEYINQILENYFTKSRNIFGRDFNGDELESILYYVKPLVESNIPEIASTIAPYLKKPATPNLNIRTH